MIVESLEGMKEGRWYTFTVDGFTDEDQRKKYTKKETYRLLKKYKHFMLFEKKSGIKESFTNNEIAQKIAEGGIEA